MNKNFVRVVCLSAALTLSACLMPKSISKNIIMPVNAVSSATINNNDCEDHDHYYDNEEETKEITLSFAGDCTLGTDKDFSYRGSFPDVADKKGYDHFFDGVREVFEADTATIVNLETTLTNAKSETPKKFNFKGDPDYTEILKDGSVEVVNLANNHTMDFKEKGYKDTQDNLIDAHIGFYGDNCFLIKEINGVKIGFAGFQGFSNDTKTRAQVREAMNFFKDKDMDLKIVSFHWGVERENYFNETQEALGKYAIDCGADLVVGHHPHVLQGIQEYKDKYIVYSLGNFVFGGNSNPKDKDSMIFQQTFNFEDNDLVDSSINIIPVSISSEEDYNDYQPTILDGEDEARVLRRINKYSENFHYSK